MNDLQKKEFELLKYFLDICEKLNLKYYLVCGSALGAVKYKGFIPWDDDMDIALPREDYEKFLEKAPSMLPENLFLQNYRTDKNFPAVFSKLRNSSTTYIESGYKNLKINHGVFIDIFALDGYPSDPAEISKFEKKKLWFVRKYLCALAPAGSTKARIMRQVLRFAGCHRNTAKSLAEYEKMIVSCDNTQVWCNYGNFRGYMEKLPCDVYGEGVEADFEGIKVRIPSKYDEYLREKYGDYTQDPPLEEQVGHHYYEVLDLEKPYTEYI